MIDLNYTEVPVSKEHDINPLFTTWKNGKCTRLDEGKVVTLYIGHKEEIRTNEDSEEEIVMMAFPIRVKKPIVRDMAINAAEMEVYGLADAMEVASFNASLARKARANADDIEVKEHDEFIAWVKNELTEIGV